MPPQHVYGRNLHEGAIRKNNNHATYRYAFAIPELIFTSEKKAIAEFAERAASSDL